MYNEKKFWKLAHKVIKKGVTKEEFVKKVFKYKNLIPHRPEDPKFLPFILDTAYDAWHNGTEFGAWRPFR